MDKELESGTQVTEEKTDDGNTEQMSQISEMMASFEPQKEEHPEEKNEEEEDLSEKKEEENNEDPSEKKEEEPTPQEKEISELKSQIATLTEKLNASTAIDDKKKEENQDENTYFTERLNEVQNDLISEYVSEEDYDDVFEKREKLNEVLKRVQSDTLQGVFRSIPKIIASIIPQHVMLYTKTMEFYKANPDLVEHRAKVGELIDETSAKNPGWNLDKVLAHVGGSGEDVGEVRRVLGLKKKAEKVAENSNIKRPSFAKPSHVKKPGNEAKLTGIDKEIADMIDANS